MTGGFGAVPEELRQTANKIGDVVGGVGGMIWSGPTGDYGHPGVQAGWEQFIERMKDQICTLRDKATEHGEGLSAAALKYLESDSSADGVLGRLGDVLDGGTGPVGGGFTGGLGDLGGPASEIPGGGFTGGLGDLGGRGGSGGLGDLGGPASEIPGGGFTGGLGDILDGKESGSGSGGFMNPDVADRLDPDAAKPKDISDMDAGEIGERIGREQNGPLF